MSGSVVCIEKEGGLKIPRGLAVWIENYAGIRVNGNEEEVLAFLEENWPLVVRVCELLLVSER